MIVRPQEFFVPHVHGRQFDTGAIFLPQFLEKQVNARLFPALATDPDGAPPFQVTDDNPVVVSLANGYLINADGAGSGQPRQINLFLHVELIQILYCAVVQAFHPGDGPRYSLPTCMAKRWL